MTDYNRYGEPLPEYDRQKEIDRRRAWRENEKYMSEMERDLTVLRRALEIAYIAGESIEEDFPSPIECVAQARKEVDDE